MRKELLLTVSAAALVFGVAQTAFAKKTAEELAIVRCSNNGNGNGDEFVAFGGPPGDCEKFITNESQDQPGQPGQGSDDDPN